MSLYPCKQSLRPVDSNDPPIIPTQAIVHVAVNGTTPGIQTGPAFHDGLDWHFYCDKGPGDPWDIISQLRDTAIQADANFRANGPRADGTGAISMETEGTGDEPWTDDQVRAIIWWFGWANKIDGIPLVICPAWDAPGLGYHRLFNEWNQPYHSCPGDQKVWQFRNVIIPAIQALVEPLPTTAKDDSMLLIVQQKEDGPGSPWYLTDGIRKRAIGNKSEAISIVRDIKATGGLIGYDPTNGDVNPIVRTKSELDLGSMT